MQRKKFDDILDLLLSYCCVAQNKTRVWRDEYWDVFMTEDDGEFRRMVRRYMDDNQVRRMPSPRILRKQYGWKWPDKPQQRHQCDRGPAPDPNDPEDRKLMQKGFSYVKRLMPEEVRKRFEDILFGKKTPF